MTTAEEEAKRKADEEEAARKAEEDETSEEELTAEQLKAKLADSKKRIRELNRESAERRKKLEALEKAEGEAEIARKKAEEDSLAKNQEWQKLAETRAAELTSQKTELETLRGQADKYKIALEAQLAKAKEKLPKHLLPLIDKLDPVDQLAYITEHAEELGAKPATYGETPDPKQKRLSKDDEREAQNAQRSIISQSF